AGGRGAGVGVGRRTWSRAVKEKVINMVKGEKMRERAPAPQRPASTATRFGRAEYYIAILGKPSVNDPWMIQFGGHHLAINVTVAGPAHRVPPNPPPRPPPLDHLYRPTTTTRVHVHD